VPSGKAGIKRSNDSAIPLARLSRRQIFIAVLSGIRLNATRDLIPARHVKASPLPRREPDSQRRLGADENGVAEIVRGMVARARARACERDGARGNLAFE